MFDDYVFANDQAMRGHLAEGGKNAAYMFIGVHEREDYRQLSAHVHQMRGLHPSAARESRHGMECCRTGHILFPQQVQDFEIQWLVVPLVGFIQIQSDLDSHAGILQQPSKSHARQNCRE